MSIISDFVSKINIKSFFKYLVFLFGIPLSLFIWTKTYIYKSKDTGDFNLIERLVDWVLFNFVDVFVIVNIILLIMYATIRLFKKIKNHQKFFNPLFVIIIFNLILNIIIVDIKYDMIEKERYEERANQGCNPFGD